MTQAPLKTFIIYARADAPFKDELLSHLDLFIENGLLQKWVDSDLLPGEDWEKRIEQELDAAHLVIMLVSADALRSEFIKKKELKTALEKKRAGNARVVPILVRDCMWDMHPDLSEIQLLPKDENGKIRGVAAWLSRDTAWTHCLREIKKLVDEIRAALEKEGAEKEAAQQAEVLKKQQADEAQKAERNRRRLDEATWKKVLADLENARRPAEKIALLNDYLHDLEHQNHRTAAEDLRDELQAEIEAERKLEVARKKREAEADEQKQKDEEINRLLVEGLNRLQAAEAALKKHEAKAAEQKRKQEEAEGQKGQPEMVLVKGGSFQMSDKFQVTLSDFEIGKYPVTQKLWKEIMGDNPSHFKGDNLPVETVSWDDCQAFLKKLNAKFPGKKYRLPTEAEWEYAARGGGASSRTIYAGSNDLKEVGWFSENSGTKTRPVGQKKANELGLFDLSGNVWEWCQDWYGDYPSAPQTNPTGPESGSKSVLRGGSWNFNAQNCRVSYRYAHMPGVRYGNIGFRLARTY